MDKQQMDKQQIKVFLESRGWHTYYNENYWCHPKTIKDPKSHDYTNYGMSLGKAYMFEIAND